LSLEQKIKEQQRIILEQQQSILQQSEIIQKQQELIIELKNQIKDLKRGITADAGDRGVLVSSSESILSKESQLRRIEELEQKLKEQEELYERNLKKAIKEKLEATQKLQKELEEAKIRDWQKEIAEKDEILREQEKRLNAVRIHVEKLKEEWAEKERYIEQLEEHASKYKKLELSQSNILETEEKLKRMEEVWKQKIREKDKRIKELENLLEKSKR